MQAGCIVDQKAANGVALDLLAHAFGIPEMKTMSWASCSAMGCSCQVFLAHIKKQQQARDKTFVIRMQHQLCMQGWLPE